VGTLTARELQLLRLVHDDPGLTRATAAERLGASSGTVTTLVRSLGAAHLIDEQPAQLSGGRGRPTRELLAHPFGPLVLAGVVTHADWRVSVMQIGGIELTAVQGEHDGQDGAGLVASLGSAATSLAASFPERVRGMGLAVPGIVRGAELVDAPFLGFRGLDLSAVWSGAGPFAVGNDATFAALGEASRGAAAGADLHLHLHLDAGLGGAVTTGGEVLAGAGGLGGEFGHMPFGEATVRCACGALGCWTTSVSARALAAALGEPLPRDEVGYARSVLDRARTGEPAARTAVGALASSLGRGIAGLVNALGVDLVTLGGLAPALEEIAPEELSVAYVAGLMRFRRDSAPAITTASLGGEALRTGTAEQVWSSIWHTL
jgi:predicted NBD/HSP70 family sugar kinase